MKSFPESNIGHPWRSFWWTLVIILLMLADIASPTRWGLCVLHLVLLPLAWRFLHRRVITKITVIQAAAVALAGLWHAIYGPAIVVFLPSTHWLVEAIIDTVNHRRTLYFDPVRLWTFVALMAAVYFHVFLRGRLRLRLKHQHLLQQGVRRRSQEVARVNHALREEVARRQATQHRLDQSETTYQSIMDRMHLQVARKNAAGVFTYANDPFCAELGLLPIDVIGSTDEDLYAPELAARYRADDLSVMETGVHVDRVAEHPGADGRPGFVQVFKAPEYDQHGHCIGIQAIFWDVTEKHRGAMALQNSEARKRALFEAAADAVLLVDDRNVIMEANPAAMQLLQAGGGRLVGRPLGDLIMPVATNEQPQFTTATFRQETATWDTLSFAQRHQLRLRRGDGVAFDSEVSMHAIPLGERDGRAVIIRDVTLQQQAFDAMREAKAVAEQANRTKTQFMAGISHELRTPLGGIRGLTELLAGQSLSALSRRYVNLISQNTELLHDAIEDILDFSAIEAGRVAIDPHLIDLHETVGDAFGCLAVRVADKPVRLNLSIDPRLPRRVVADAKRIRQIIVNLVGNAIKFTPRGLVSLRLAMAEPNPGGAATDDSRPPRKKCTFELVITDTGIGIAPENQLRIFDAFEQADRGTNKRYGGTGLGLAIARGLAERMGGGIELSSEAGMGSCFRVRLELKLAGSSDKTIDPPPVPRPDSTRGTVVISVDNDAIESALTETLNFDGWTACRPDQVAARPLASRKGQRNTANRETTPIYWILVNRTADAAWRARARKSTDRVLWLTHTGEPTPRRARTEDTIIIEPVHPDELRRWLHGEPLRQSGRGAAIPMLPQAEIDTAPSAVAESNNSTDRAGRFHLLLVDDSPTNRLVIHDQLVSVGHRVTTADGGTAALAHFRRESFDCVLMDLQMPGMDGTEVAAKLAALAEQLQRPLPPMIALTAHVTDQHREMCRDAGMVGYITKPIHLEPLVAEIEKAVQRPGPTTELAGPYQAPDAESENSDDWWARLAAFCGDDDSTMASVCEGIAEEIPELIERLDRAATDGNNKAFKTAAHTLKSCLRYVAPPAHNRRASELERNSSDAEWFERLHQDLQSQVEAGVPSTTDNVADELKELRRVQEIARAWATTVQTPPSREPSLLLPDGAPPVL
ncbi:hybrid sensor histidine kinase/response regulator [Allorhodopirellula heiligendammensis]|uniref:histidine kinase n=1 Tax=Allorhodopirellula heiligendammensis TaxID=2714739 RepID=A0A5C6C0D9_9BACT|nr:response regulator [Allorhodopirellula heiligendammensis]TWU16349.1 Sensor histidine kinase RcsC [Allorhodopirellula heiligendammensis]